MKKLKTFLPALMVAFSLIASLTASIAWFSSTVTFKDENKLMGETEGAYFAYGDGSSLKPFGINHPRHLYNLAWLQYLGIFNNRTLGPDSGPCYFELDPNMEGSLDMTGYTHLPPIGTETQPFIGVFNGNGKTITNLNITNKYSDMEKHPTAVSGNNFVVPHIVGLFGVIGTYGGGDTANYENITNAVYNLKIDSATITTKVTDSLVGVLAGYVNGPVADVGISNSSIDVSGQSTTKYSTYNNISDYSVIGFCEEEYKEKVNHSVTTLYQPTTPASNDVIVQEDGDNQGWGGSIDMKTMYEGLLNVWNGYSSQGAYHYYTTRTDNYNIDGELEGEPIYGGSTLWSSGYYNYYPAQQTNGSGQITSQYTFAHRSDLDNFMYLYGKRTKTISNAMTVTKNYYEDYDAFYISYTVDGIEHFLSHSGNTVVDQTNVELATRWAIDEENRLFSMNGTPNNYTNYYLMGSGTTLSMTTNVNYGTSWDTNNDLTYFSYTYDNTKYAIQYDSTWRLVTDTSTPGYYTIHDDTRDVFVNYSGTTLTTGDSDSPSHWYFDPSQGYYMVSGSTKYYISWTEDGFLNTDDHYDLYYVPTNHVNGTASNSLLGYDNGSEWWYLYLKVKGSNKTWDETTSTSTADRFTVIYNDPIVPSNLLLSYTYAAPFKLYTTTNYTEDASFTTQETYFPLRQEKTNNIPNGIPADTNTGYVVGGANEDNELQGDIRVSRYASSSLSGKSGSTMGTVYTRDDSGTSVTIANSDFKNSQIYQKAKTSLEAVFAANTSYIYGLHFMNAEIEYGVGKSVYAQGAVINGNSDTNGVPYGTLELPTNCIDFNLKEKGYINFFAGPYFSGNNSFFSLHEIERTSNRVIHIVREISNIYTDNDETHSYIYEYKTYDTNNKRYSVPFKFNENGEKVKLDNSSYTEYESSSTKPSSYSKLVFKCSRLTSTDALKCTTRNNTTTGYPYYFEIPMNSGEYCLGSVSGGTGAYLMYLDIGANAEKTKRSAIIDIIKFSEEMQTYPKGVGVIVAGGTSSDVNSYCICIGDSYNGVINLSRSSATQATATQSVSSQKITLAYAAGSLTVTDGSNPYSLVSNTTETLLERVTYIEYHPSNNRTTKIVVTRKTTNYGTAQELVTTTKESFIMQNGEWVAQDIELYYDKMWGNGTQYGKKVTSLSNYFDNLYLDEGRTQTYSSYRSTALSGTVVLQFDTNLYGATNAGHVVVTLTPTTNVNANTHVHGLTGYDITISYEDVNGNVINITGETVVKVLNRIVTILNNNGASASVTLQLTINNTSVTSAPLTIQITIPIPNP